MQQVTELLHIDPESFGEAFARRSIAVRHELSEHPLFSLEAIAELADRLPSHSVRRERSDLPLANAGFGYVEVGRGRPSETIRNIEESGIRVSLRDIQQVDEYAELINDCLDQVAQLVEDREGGMTRRAGYLFISAPASTTPMHFDVEHSFLLQITGVKHVSVATVYDDPVARHRELDRYIDGQPCDFEAMQQTAVTTTIESGSGVYLPSFVPHWVETEAGISISFSIPFFTAHTEQVEGVSRINRRLRQLHLAAHPPGISPRRDRAKLLVFRSLQKLRSS
jgi:hypothetical protein